MRWEHATETGRRAEDMAVVPEEFIRVLRQQPGVHERRGCDTDESDVDEVWQEGMAAPRWLDDSGRLRRPQAFKRRRPR